MMKRFFIAALALAATLPAAINVQAQDDDDIYFSKKANKKAAHEALYAATEADSWETDANNDWNLDDYNRRGKESTAKEELNVGTVTADGEEVPFYYEIPDGNGGTTKVPGNKKVLKGSNVDNYIVVNDTVVLVEQYRFSDLIRRFHNPFFGYYRYSPWYDVAYYDPFYWDYCYYDPWWYVTPSFGFHWGNWYGGWSYGYYSGWYGGWYSPYYHPCPHYYSYYDVYYHNGPVYNYATGSSHRGSSRNNFGGHFAHRGGWKADGGTSRQISASSNRSYRAANGARTARTNGNPNAVAGPTLRGRNTVNGRIANSNMRSSTRRVNSATDPQTAEILARAGLNVNNVQTRRASNSSTRTYSNRNTSSYNNSDSRRADAGMYQRDNGSTRNTAPTYSTHSASRYNSGSSYSSSPSYNTRSSSSYSSSSSHSSYSSGSSYSGGSSGGGYSGGSSHSSGGGYSGGSSHSSGGSHSSGSHAGRR